jgi:hypothetical protein
MPTLDVVSSRFAALHDGIAYLAERARYEVVPSRIDVPRSLLTREIVVHRPTAKADEDTFDIRCTMLDLLEVPEYVLLLFGAELREKSELLIPTILTWDSYRP